MSQDNQISYLVELVQKIGADLVQVKEDVGQLKGDVGQLKGDVRQLKGDVGQLKGDVGQLKGDVGQLKGDVRQLKGDVGQLKRLQAKQDRSLGDLRETIYRREIKTLFGASFAKSFKIRCLDNLVHLISKSGNNDDKDISLSRLQRTNQLANKLLKDKVAESYLMHLQNTYNLSPDDPLMKDSRADIKAIGKWIGYSKRNNNSDEWLCTKLEKLSYLFRCQSENEQLNELRKCDGVGVMLAMFSANENYLLAAKQEPEEAVDLDVRGVIQISQNHCSISVGEIKSDSCAFSKAVRQLHVRAYLFEWAIRILYPDIDDFVRIGRFFTNSGIAKLPNNTIRDGISIYVHGL